MALKFIHWKRLLLAIPLVIALMVTSTFSVSARPLYYGETIPVGAVIEADVVLVGNNIVIDGTVVGDVFALGNHIRINGTIEGSLVAVAQTIRITGIVKGTSYSAAIAIELGSGARLDRNLYFGGLSIAMRKEALVNRDVSAFSLGGTLSGQINGNIKAVIGPYEILKLIFDALKVNVQLPGMIYDEPTLPGATPQNLPLMQPTLQSTSRTSNSSSPYPGSHLMLYQLTTSSTVSQALAPASSGIEITTMVPTQVIISGITRSLNQTTPEAGVVIDWRQISDWFLGRLRSLVVLMVFCLLAYWLMPGTITRASGMLHKKPLQSLGTGLVGALISFNAVLAAILVAAIITAIGFWLIFATIWEVGVFVWSAGLSLVVLFIIAASLFVFYVTKTIIAYTLAGLILKRVKNKATWLQFLSLVFGLVIYVILSGLPYAGWVIGILATAFGMGSAWLDYRERRMLQKQPPSSREKRPSTKPDRKVAQKTRST